MACDRKRVGPAGVAVSAGLLVLALAAQAAPVQWTGNSGGAWITLFVDGQKAAGAARSQLGELYTEVELSGSGRGAAYSGSLRGVARRAGSVTPLAGEWRARLSSPPSITCTIRPRGKPPRTLNVALLRSASYALLRCAWVRGAATRTPRGGTPRVPLRANDPIRIGDAIDTDASGAAILILGDRSVVLMQEKTRVVVPEVPENAAGVQKARVDTGKVWFAVRKVQERGQFEVETDEAVAAVRGTEFLVEVGEEGETSITTAEGEVAITDAARKRPFTALRPGMRWGLAARRLRMSNHWGGPRTHDLRAMIGAWRPMLEEADLAWPLRREGKRAFWQDRLLSGAPGGPGRRGPGGRPGFRRRR